MTVIQDGNKYTYKLKLDNGQVVSMTITRELYMDSVFYYVLLFINKRGKGYEEGHQTGRAGIEGLLWAKEMLKDFIEEIKKIKDRKHTICIFWDDNRRRDVYARGLKDLGFRFSTLVKWKCLQLVIPRIE